MDAQLKRGILDISVLSVLSAGDSYGYQLMKDLSPHVSITESTLYPILKRLEAARALTVYTVEHNGRLRKFYAITDEGKNRIGEFLEDFKDVMTAYQFIKEEYDKDGKI